jgi:hypothetical protein
MRIMMMIIMMMIIMVMKITIANGKRYRSHKNK